MSVQELKKELAALQESQRAEVSAFLFHLRHAADPEYQAILERRLNDKDPSHWLTVDEFERRLDEKH